YDKRFGQKYPKFITPETFKLAYNFNKEYDKWYDAKMEELENELAKIQEDVTQNKERIRAINANIEHMMSGFSPEQVAKDPKFKN
ncbi:hypothetical protein KKG31_06050, partial [Patescibacteria group bacterium]|nr:hypothetical protein [Patescibacteria group bacterium]